MTRDLRVPRSRPMPHGHIRVSGRAAPLGGSGFPRTPHPGWAALGRRATWPTRDGSVEEAHVLLWEFPFPVHREEPPALVALGGEGVDDRGTLSVYWGSAPHVSAAFLESRRGCHPASIVVVVGPMPRESRRHVREIKAAVVIGVSSPCSCYALGLASPLRLFASSVPTSFVRFAFRRSTSRQWAAAVHPPVPTPSCAEEQEVHPGLEVRPSWPRAGLVRCCRRPPS